MVGWLIGLVGWLIDWLVGWLVELLYGSFLGMELMECAEERKECAGGVPPRRSTLRTTTVLHTGTSPRRGWSPSWRVVALIFLYKIQLH